MEKVHLCRNLETWHEYQKFEVNTKSADTLAEFLNKINKLGCVWYI